VTSRRRVPTATDDDHDDEGERAMRVHEGTLDGSGMRFALVAGRFNEVVVTQLVAGAADCLRRHGVADDDIELAWVPGAYEIPLVARKLAETGRFDAVVTLGAVVRGQTAHFEYVAGEAAQVGRIALETGVPVTFGTLTTETFEQAVDRAGGKLGNKGWEAALAALETARLLASIAE
jgi:6,7-dimethyl-8-ribityllumazine synthase